MGGGGRGEWPAGKDRTKSDAEGKRRGNLGTQAQKLAQNKMLIISTLGAEEDQDEGERQLKFVNSTFTQDTEEKYCVENIEKDENVLMERIRDAKDWALTNGLTFPVPRSKLKCDTCGKINESVVLDDMAQFVPFTLYPSPFPRELFDQAIKVNKALLLMYFRASLPHNFEFLKELHKSVLAVSPSLRSNADQIESQHKKGIRQPLMLICIRADYMASEEIDEKSNAKKYVLKQIELNGGSIGGYGTPQPLTALHRRMLSNVGIDNSTSVMPENQTSEMLATAIYRAWEEFGDPKAVILFVHPKIRMFLLVEARAIQYAIERIFEGKPKPKCVFLTLEEGIDRLKLNSDNFLILDGKFTVAVSMARNATDDLTTKANFPVWRAIKLSKAIQVWNTLFLLAHSKKVQQELSKPGVVEHFFRMSDEAHLAAEVRRVMTKSWSIGADEEEAEKIIRMVKANPDNFVMKWNEVTPLKKGSKNVYFGDEIIAKLDSMDKKERDTFFIMEKLRPMVVKNHFVRAHDKPLLNTDVNIELGVHGCLLGNVVDGTVIDDFWPGTVIKTKLASENEGGVMKGHSVVDTLYLV
ncbi:hypothetical protein niasHS_009400 [Heterodera schachtii]|uniref:Glutathione synthetase n=1 Tax=Heterodera schachtii TaxID=97005 RepID=A0ABD2JBW5_HETSC